MREIVYSCDSCGKAFGKKAHINTRNGDFGISYIHDGHGQWRRKFAKLQENEHHFCDDKCFIHWIKQALFKVRAEIKGLKEAR